MATPAGTLEILLGKLIPYFVLGMGSMLIAVATSRLLFGLPLRGSLTAICAVSAAFLLAALGQGLLISTAAKNQFLAAQGAVISAFLPAMFLSGFLFEISSMPLPLRTDRTSAACTLPGLGPSQHTPGRGYSDNPGNKHPGHVGYRGVLFDTHGPDDGEKTGVAHGGSHSVADLERVPG